MIMMGLRYHATVFKCDAPNNRHCGSISRDVRENKMKWEQRLKELKEAKVKEISNSNIGYKLRSRSMLTALGEDCQ